MSINSSKTHSIRYLRNTIFFTRYLRRSWFVKSLWLTPKYKEMLFLCSKLWSPQIWELFPILLRKKCHHPISFLKTTVNKFHTFLCLTRQSPSSKTSSIFFRDTCQHTNHLRSSLQKTSKVRKPKCNQINSITKSHRMIKISPTKKCLNKITERLFKRRRLGRRSGLKTIENLISRTMSWMTLKTPMSKSHHRDLFLTPMMI